MTQTDTNKRAQALKLYTPPPSPPFWPEGIFEAGEVYVEAPRGRNFRRPTSFIRSQKGPIKAKNRTNSTKESIYIIFSTIRGGYRSSPSKTRVLRQIATESSSKRSATFLSHNSLWYLFCNRFYPVIGQNTLLKRCVLSMHPKTQAVSAFHCIPLLTIRCSTRSFLARNPKRCLILKSK